MCVRKVGHARRSLRLSLVPHMVLKRVGILNVGILWGGLSTFNRKFSSIFSFLARHQNAWAGKSAACVLVTDQWPLAVNKLGLLIVEVIGAVEPAGEEGPRAKGNSLTIRSRVMPVKIRTWWGPPSLSPGI
jgi:hypothetical protein